MTTNYLLIRSAENTVQGITLPAPLTAREIFAKDESYTLGTRAVNVVAAHLAGNGWKPTDSRPYSASGHKLSDERKAEVEEAAFSLILNSDPQGLFDYFTSEGMLGHVFVEDITMVRGDEKVFLGTNGNIDVESEYPINVIIEVVAAANFDKNLSLVGA